MGRSLSNSLVLILRQRIAAVSASDALHQGGGNRNQGGGNRGGGNDFFGGNWFDQAFKKGK